MSDPEQPGSVHGVPEEYLPEWEVGIEAYGPGDEPGESRIRHYHPRAATEDEAREKALKQAGGRRSLIGPRDNYEVLDVSGPHDVPEVPESIRRAARLDEDQADLCEVVR